MTAEKIIRYFYILKNSDGKGFAAVSYEKGVGS